MKKPELTRSHSLTRPHKSKADAVITYHLHSPCCVQWWTETQHDCTISSSECTRAINAEISSCVSYAIGRYMLWTYIVEYVRWQCDPALHQSLNGFYYTFVNAIPQILWICLTAFYRSSERVLHFDWKRMWSKDENFIDIGRWCLCSCVRASKIVEKAFSARFLRKFEQLFGSGAFSCVLILLFSLFFSLVMRHSYICKRNAQFYLYTFFIFIFCCFCRPVRYCFSWPYHTSKQIAGKRTIAIDVVERANGKMI